MVWHIAGQVGDAFPIVSSPQSLCECHGDINKLKIKHIIRHYTPVSNETLESVYEFNYQITSMRQ